MDLVLSHINEKENLLEILEKNYNKDLKLGYTTFGPHRHNITFLKNGIDILPRLSQGQKRTVVLSMRIAQYKFLKLKLNLNPILLIDDVTGELDDLRRNAFVNLLTNSDSDSVSVSNSGQVIVTAPNLSEIEKKIFSINKNCYVYKINEVGQNPELENFGN